jgi:hypothetical protein
MLDQSQSTSLIFLCRDFSGSQGWTLALCTKVEDVGLIESDPISVQGVSRYWEGTLETGTG